MIQPESVKIPIGPVARGRVAQLIARQQELRAQLTADPLLDLKTVCTVLNVSYSTLNCLLASGKLRAWQAVPHGKRKVRSSILQAFLRQGDQYGVTS